MTFTVLYIGVLLTIHSLLNCRLSCYVEDHVLVKSKRILEKVIVQLIIFLYQSAHKRVYCAFIDYRKAFDSINRPLLWQKLISYNMNGKLLNVVKYMYDKAKSCVKIENLYSD